MASFDLAQLHFSSAESDAFYAALLDGASRLPGVEAAGLPSRDLAGSWTFDPANAIRADILLQRLLAKAAAVLGIVALLLASLGLYGVTSYSVTTRAREIAVGMGVGARADQVVAMIWSSDRVRPSDQAEPRDGRADSTQADRLR